MKNHIRADGKLIQTNKRWSALKQSQRTWVHEVTAKEWVANIEHTGKLPVKKRKVEIINAVHEQVVQRDIWIPYFELEQAVNKAIDRLNRKSPLFELSTADGEKKGC